MPFPTSILCVTVIFFFFFFHFLRASKLAYPLWNFFWSMVTSRNQCRQNVICLYIKTWLDWLDSIRSRTTWIEVAQVFMVVLMATRFLVFQWKPYLCHLTHLSTAERTERELLHRKVKTKLRHVTSWRWKFQFRNETLFCWKMTLRFISGMSTLSHAALQRFYILTFKHIYFAVF